MVFSIHVQHLMARRAWRSSHSSGDMFYFRPNSPFAPERTRWQAGFVRRRARKLGW